VQGYVKKAREFLDSLLVVEVTHASKSSVGECFIDWGAFKPLEQLHDFTDRIVSREILTFATAFLP
jgi:hypothetical protein